VTELSTGADVDVIQQLLPARLLTIARYVAMAVRPFVCPAQADTVSKRLKNRAHFWRKDCTRLILHCVL